jgi:UBA/TS-N domain.
MNKGLQPWPQGTSVENFRGSMQITEPVCLKEVQPGETVNITFTVVVPNQQGKHKGIWSVMVNGECAGVLKAKFYVAAETIEAKVATLTSMGFKKELAQKALEDNQGDLDLAISSMLKQ